MAGLYFVCDVHIPPQLASFFRARGFEAIHAFDVGLETADDITLWEFAKARDGVIVTKDKDFVAMDAAQPGPRVILVCIGNSTNRVLLSRFERLLPEILGHFEAGRRLVELR